MRMINQRCVLVAAMDGQFTFPIAKLEEVVKFYRAEIPSSENLPFSETEITHPKPEVTQQVHLNILSFIYNIDSEMLFKQPENGQSELGITVGSIRPILALCSLMQKFMSRCMVYDFVLNDLLNPTSKRTLRIFSGIMNYVLFRKEAAVDFNQLKNSWNESLDYFAKLKRGNEELQARINKRKSVFTNTDNEIQSAAKEASTAQDLEDELAKKANETRDEVSQLKGTLKENIKVLDQLKAELVVKKDEEILLRARIVENPEKIIADIKHKNMNLQNFKAHLEEKVRQGKEFKEKEEEQKICQDNLNFALEVLGETSSFVEQGKRLKKELGEVESELQRDDCLLRNLAQKQELTRQTIDQQQAYLATFLNISQRKKEEYAKEIEMCNRELEQLQAQEGFARLQVEEQCTNDMIAAEEQNLKMELQEYETLSFKLTNHVDHFFSDMRLSVDVFMQSWDTLVEELSCLEKEMDE
uniref:kinetochore protein Nuf2 isoform X1 n=1 Tax=Myxine glutinosa TaxID=7769 RepID=UPI00358F735E